VPTTYLVLRVVHIVCGALWLGVTVFLAWLLMPALEESGPAGRTLVAALFRRGLPVFIPIVASLSIVSGVWLYWRYTAGFSPAISRTHGAMMYGAGGLVAIVAYVVGAAVTGRSVARARTLGEQADAMAAGSRRDAVIQMAARLNRRARATGRLVSILLLLTLALMSLALFV
jgi:hypothetical protein